MEHCLIKGARCTKCCQVLTIHVGKNYKDWCKYVRRYGYPVDFKGSRVYHLFRQISKRRAKKINRHLVEQIGNSQQYFTCKNLCEKGCKDYSNRPDTCSGYPFYGRNREVMSVEQLPLYSPDCTYFVEIE